MLGKIKQKGKRKWLKRMFNLGKIIALNPYLFLNAGSGSVKNVYGTKTMGTRTHLENTAGAEIGVNQLTGLSAPDVNTLRRPSTINYMR